MSDVRRIYLTGSYKDKYNSLSYQSPLKLYNSPSDSPTKARVYPDLEIGFRKVKSAYPNVIGLKSTSTPHHYNKVGSAPAAGNRDPIGLNSNNRRNSTSNQSGAGNANTPMKKCLEKCFKY